MDLYYVTLGAFFLVVGAFSAVALLLALRECLTPDPPGRAVWEEQPARHHPPRSKAPPG